jgi:hypothetical protein
MSRSRLSFPTGIANHLFQERGRNNGSNATDAPKGENIRPAETKSRPLGPTPSLVSDNDVVLCALYECLLTFAFLQITVDP